MEYKYPKQEFLDWLDQQHCPSVAAIGFAVLSEVKNRMELTSVREIGYLSQPVDQLIDEWFKPKEKKRNESTTKTR